jgi:putative lipoprotein
MMTSALIFSAIALTPADLGSVSGTVAYRERMALPAEAEVAVFLDEFTKDGQHHNVASVAMKVGSQQVPISFSLPYQASALAKGSTIGVRAEIRTSKGVLFVSPRAETVVSNGKSKADLMLVRSRAPHAPLDNVNWELFAIGNDPLNWSERRPTLKFVNGQLQGFSGVNRFSGTYRTQSSTMQIDPGAMTRMAGTPERMEVEARLTTQLPLVTRFGIFEGELVLFRGDKELFRFRNAK